MTNKDFFQRVPNATSFQVLDHVTWNNNLTRLDYFNPLASGSNMRLVLSFSQSLTSGISSVIAGSSYTAIEANLDMWNGTDNIYFPEDGLYAILTSHNHASSIVGRRLFSGVVCDDTGTPVRNVVRFYDNVVANVPRAVDFQFNVFSNYFLVLSAFQNSGSTQTVTGTVIVQKISQVYEGLPS